MNIFISYSHKDIKFKNELLEELNHLERIGGIQLWHDNRIRPGGEWKREIEDQLAKADAAILLLSNQFLSSTFCQDKEIPGLLRRHHGEGVKIYPVTVHPCNYRMYPWLSDLYIQPRTKNHKVKPLSTMKPPERKEFYVEFCEEIFNDLASKAAQDTGERQELSSAEQREELAQSLASAYHAGQNATIKDLMKSYKWLYDKGLDKLAFDLVEAFEMTLSRRGLGISDAHHRELLALLKAGFPVAPVHLEGLSDMDIEALLANPGYPALMLGIRLTEKDYSVALGQLRKVGRGLNFRNCALIAYALGQCNRKGGHLDEAIGEYGLALLRIDGWRGERCECGPKCPRDGLLVEIHRGMGAALRKKEDWEKAERHFEIARSYLTGRVANTINADVQFGHGYLVFERAIKERENIGEEAYRDQLNEAKKLFEKSHALRLGWDAPLARFYIVKELLGETDIPGYWMARECAFFGGGPESRLTAVNCGFAILLADLGNANTPDRYLTSQELYEELDAVFRETLVSKGTRVCHGFDISVIVGSRDLGADRYLQLVNELLQESSKWDLRSMAEQLEQIEHFRRTHDVKGGRVTD